MRTPRSCSWFWLLMLPLFLMNELCSLEDYEDEFDAYYAKWDSVNLTESKHKTILVAPESDFEGVPSHYALRNIADEILINESKDKTVVGMTACARGYRLKKSKKVTSLNDILGFAVKNGTVRVENDR